ncbi:MAG: phospho-sugar mutase [Candidatus Doudnabacteria bacterium]|nr:phospho-sugar mutase [Candidatus Doudnabacteria bacterium]
MDTTIQSVLDTALAEKRLNKTAYDEIVKWLTDEEFEEFLPELRARLSQPDWDKLMDAFYRVLIFGTGGLRGVMDLGTNRLNAYMIRWASQAYAQYLLKYKPDIAHKGIAIAYDSRINSQEFMKETARVLAANGIPVYIFKYYRATPELSFTVRHLGLAGGIVVTASHNPPEFNGYKVYDERGVQVLPEVGLQIELEFKAVEKIHKITFDEAVQTGVIRYIDDSVDEAFAESAKKVSVYPGRDVKIVYSPLHGVGSQSVLPVLKALGFKDIEVVEEQMSLDGNFPNVEGHFPNPEFSIVYKEAIALAQKVNPDIIIVSDPDADRCGIALQQPNGEWVSLNGNQGAVLMGYFYMNALKEAGRLPQHPVVIKTSVTTDLLRDVAESFGAETIGDLLVGFKFIGDRQEHLPSEKTFLFGSEESVGYLFSNDYRDKGAETPAIVAAEMAAWCKANGTTGMQLLESIYQKYGYYAERLFYRLIEGFGSFDQMNMAMAELRRQLPTEIAGRKVVKVIDRMTGEVKDGQTGAVLETRGWDKGDMLSFFFSDDERNVVHVRPSGTEPKMKYYTAIKGSLQEKTKGDIDAEAEAVEVAMAKIFEDILVGVKVDVF